MQGKKQSIQIASDTVKILDKDFKSAIISIFKKLKETGFKELKESMRPVPTIENINKKRNFVKC